MTVLCVSSSLLHFVCQSLYTACITRKLKLVLPFCKWYDLLLYRELKSLFAILAIFRFTKLPKMATICCMTEAAKNGDKWFHIILPKMAIIYYSMEYLSHFFCHFWQFLLLNQ